MISKIDEMNIRGYLLHEVIGYPSPIARTSIPSTVTHIPQLTVHARLGYYEDDVNLQLENADRLFCLLQT